MNENFGCVVIVLDDESQILIGKRKNGYKAGCYGIPGGRVGSQEKLIDAAKRELWEETGLAANELEHVGVVREWQEQNTFIHFVYLCRDWKNEVQLKEPDKCEGWLWAKLDRLPEPVLPGHKKAITMYLDKQILQDL